MRKKWKEGGKLVRRSFGSFARKLTARGNCDSVPINTVDAFPKRVAADAR